MIGHGEGWLISNSQPYGYLFFEEDLLTFIYRTKSVDTITTATWDIETIIGQDEQVYFKLVLEGDIQTLGVGTFCQQYMYADATPLDGNMFLYEKVK